MTMVTVHPLRLAATIAHAKLMANHGMPLTRVAPKVKDVVAEYRLDLLATQRGEKVPRTWAQVLPMLEQIKATLQPA